VPRPHAGQFVVVDYDKTNVLCLVLYRNVEYTKYTVHYYYFYRAAWNADAV